MQHFSFLLSKAVDAFRIVCLWKVGFMGTGFVYWFVEMGGGVL
jgi:hypothetical protein